MKLHVIVALSLALSCSVALAGVIRGEEAFADGVTATDAPIEAPSEDRDDLVPQKKVKRTLGVDKEMKNEYEFPVLGGGSLKVSKFMKYNDGGAISGLPFVIDTIGSNAEKLIKTINGNNQFSNQGDSSCICPGVAASPRNVVHEPQLVINPQPIGVSVPTVIGYQTNVQTPPAAVYQPNFAPQLDVVHEPISRNFPDSSCICPGVASASNVVHEPQPVINPQPIGVSIPTVVEYQANVQTPPAAVYQPNFAPQLDVVHKPISQNIPDLPVPTYQPQLVVQPSYPVVYQPSAVPQNQVDNRPCCVDVPQTTSANSAITASGGLSFTDKIVGPVKQLLQAKLASVSEFHAKNMANLNELIDKTKAAKGEFLSNALGSLAAGVSVNADTSVKPCCVPSTPCNC